VGYLNHFSDLTDGRQAGRVVYPLDEVLLLALLAVLAGADTFSDIARFGEKKLALLRRFRPFKDGTPPHDRVGAIFAAQFQRCFGAWVAAVTGIPAAVIAIDGKTVRRSAARRTARRRSTWSRLSSPASGSCLARSRWRKSPTRPSRSPSC
jgi:hypothetical protein